MKIISWIVFVALMYVLFVKVTPIVEEVKAILSEIEYFISTL